MKLFLLGATGRTGRLVVDQALARGHSVTAVVRARTALQAQPRLNIAPIDPLHADRLAPALAGHDVVMSCLGQRSRADRHLLRDAASVTLDALASTGVRRYLLVSQGLLFASMNPIILLLRLILARHVAESTDMEKLVSASDTDWTIVRPPRLLEGGTSRGYRVEAGAQPKGPWSMQRYDLATYLMDEAERGGSTRAQ